MPKINRTRLVNVIYGDELNRCIPDLITDAQGEDCLHKLINNGGKSIISCFMLQPFCWQYDRYPVRSAEPLYDIKKYFTEKGTNTEPCYVLQELLLEDGTFLLVGIGVQNLKNNEPLRKVSFIYKYSDMKHPCSLSNLELYDTDNQGRKIIRNVAKMDDWLKKQRAKYCSELKGVYHRTKEDYDAFYEELSNYHISKEEIFNIYLKFNAKECNISTLFTKDKITTSTKLIDTWIIPYINEKINKDNTEFLSDIIKALSNYTIHKKEKEDVIKKLSQFKEFLTEWETLEKCVSERQELMSRTDTIEGQLVWLKNKTIEIQNSLEQSIKNMDLEMIRVKEELKNASFHHTSLAIKNQLESYNAAQHQLNQLKQIVSEYESQLATLQNQQKLLEAKKDYDEWQKLVTLIHTLKAKQNPEEKAELEKQSKNIRYSLHQAIKEEYKELNNSLSKIKQSTKENQSHIESLNQSQKTLQVEYSELNKKQGIIQGKILYLQEQIKTECEACDIDSTAMSAGLTPISQKLLDDAVRQQQSTMECLTNELATLDHQKLEIAKEMDQITTQMNDWTVKKSVLESLKEGVQKEQLRYQEQLLNIQSLASDLFIEYMVPEQIKSVLASKEKKVASSLQEVKEKLNQIDDVLNFYLGNANEMNSLIEKQLLQHKIDFMKGSDFMRRDKALSARLFEKIPFLPYAIILSKDSFKALQKVTLNEFTKTLLPVLIQEELDSYEFTNTGSLFSIGDQAVLLGGYDKDFMNAEYIEQKIQHYQELRIKAYKEQEALEKTKSKIGRLHHLVDIFMETYAKDENEKLQTQIDEYTYRINQYGELISNSLQQLHAKREDRIHLEEKESFERERIINLKDQHNRTLQLTAVLKDYSDVGQQLTDTLSRKEIMESKLEQIEQQKSELYTLLTDGRTKYSEYHIELNRLQQSEFAQYLDGEYEGIICMDQNGIPLSKEALLSQLHVLMEDDRFVELKTLDQQITEATNAATIAKKDFDSNNIEATSLTGIVYDRSALSKIKEEVEVIRSHKDSKKEEYAREQGRLMSELADINDKIAECHKKHGQKYDPSVVTKDYIHEIQTMNQEIAKLELIRDEKKRYKDKIVTVLEEWTIDPKILLVPIMENVDENNCLELKKTLSDKLNYLKKQCSTNMEMIHDSVTEYQRTYVNKYNNEDLKRMLYQVETAVKEDSITITITQRIREKLQNYIDKNENDAEVLEKERSIILKEVLPKCEAIRKELQNFDRYSVMNEEKLIQLEKVATQGYDDAVIEEIDIAISAAMKKETMQEISDEYTRRLTLQSLMRVYCNTPTIRVKVMKYEFTTKGSHFLTPFEYCHDSNGASGAQSLICVFEILLTLTRYLKASSPNKKDFSYTTFYFIDNPFGTITTSFFIDTLFSILNYFGAQLISFTDISETCILEVNKHIFDYRFESHNQQHYLKASRIAGDSLPKEYLCNYKFEEKQISMFDF